MDGPNRQDEDVGTSFSMRSLVTTVLGSYDSKTCSDFFDTGSGGFYLSCTSIGNPQTNFKIERKEGKVLVRSYPAGAA